MITLPDHVQRRLAFLGLCNPSIVRTSVNFRGLTPLEYVSEVTRAIESRIAGWVAKHGPIQPDKYGWTPHWYDSEEWLAAEFSQGARAKIEAANKKHRERIRTEAATMTLAQRYERWQAASTYRLKFPRDPWSKCRGKFRSIDKAQKYIESAYAPGYTTEPYVQLIRRRPDGHMRVVAEYSSGQWIGPLEAAGFVSHPVRG